MPIVLTQNEKSAADIVYADELGISYEYPPRYRSLIQPGEQFVYYRGKRRADGSIQVPHYLGTGMIGKVTKHEGMYRCSIGNYRPFESVVPFKINGQYLEPAANGRTSKEVGLHFRTGVRTLDQKSFAAICKAGFRPDKKKPTKTTVKKVKREPQAPGDNDSKQEMELATNLAIAEAKSRWPSANVFTAPPNNQFTLAVRISKGDRRHIAVKGTIAPDPLVRLTTDEISYSKAHGEAYSIWVFYDLNLDSGTGRFVVHDGPITDEDIDLPAALHGGKLRTRGKGKKIGPIGG